MARLLFWLLTPILYWYGAYRLLWTTMPPVDDGYGPTLSFYWGTSPLSPTAAEYAANRDWFDAHFQRPHKIAACVLALLACSAVAITTRRSYRHWSLSCSTAAGVTLALMLTLFVVLDVGSRSEILAFPRIFAWEPDVIKHLMTLLGTLAFMSGILAWANQRITGARPWRRTQLRP